MKTRLLHDAEAAAQVLRAGGLVAFPTETVYGLGADASNTAAVARLFEAKGRPSDNPLIVHLADVADWPRAAREMTAVGRRILELFSPGPVTVLLPKAVNICSAATAGLDSVGLRIPDHELARDLLRRAAIPIAAPSANRSGRPSGTTWESVLEDLDGRIDAILCGDLPHIGLESSVIDCLGEAPILYRTGAIGLADLQLHFPKARQLVPSSPSHEAQPTHTVVSPGLNHPHYQPRARVILLETGTTGNLATTNEITHWLMPQHLSSLRVAYAGLHSAPAGAIFSECFPSWAEYGKGFYEFLRGADRLQADVVLLQAVPIDAAHQLGVAAALRDRQRRAAGLLGT